MEGERERRGLVEREQHHHQHRNEEEREHEGRVDREDPALPPRAHTPLYRRVWEIATYTAAKTRTIRNESAAPPGWFPNVTN